MQHANHITHDIIIIGGGIAGLWALNTLNKAGYQTLLLESQALGAGQTIASQGIIHGGSKYAFENWLSPMAQQMKNMPERWRQCLAGNGELDLRCVTRLSEKQLLWLPPDLKNTLLAFIAAKSLKGRMHKLKRESYPPPFNHIHFKGNVFELDEPVLDVPSLLDTLKKQQKEHIQFSPHDNTHYDFDEKGKLQGIQCLDQHYRAALYLFCAGKENEKFIQQAKVKHIKTQRRPLKMLCLKPFNFPLYAHCIDKKFKPSLTVTSHPLPNGSYAWYVGGALAERGVDQNDERLIESGKQSLKAFFPWIPFHVTEGKTHFVERAEPFEKQGNIPLSPKVEEHENLLFAWPIKLAYSPLLSDLILKKVKEKISPKIQPSGILNTSHVAVATPPWQETSGWR